MADETSNLIAGRNWSVDAAGIPSLKRTYKVLLEDGVNLPADGEKASFADVPSVDSEHPNISGLYVSGYEVKEGSGADKNTLDVDVTYSRKTFETGTFPGEEPTEVEMEVTEWGWDSGTEDRELTEAIDGTAVLNSAQDPFDSVPRYSVPAPTFTKVFKTKTRLVGAILDYSCKVNDQSITIGDITYGPHTMLCSISYKRLLDDPTWNYEYTVQFKFKHNMVKVEDAIEPVEIGWDSAVVDTGMREWKDNKKVIIRMNDPETMQPVTISSPALLDGAGHARVQQSQTDVLRPYIFVFNTYERVTFPTMFYSEPPTVV